MGVVGWLELLFRTVNPLAGMLNLGIMMMLLMYWMQHHEGVEKKGKLKTTYLLHTTQCDWPDQVCYILLTYLSI